MNDEEIELYLPDCKKLTKPYDKLWYYHLVVSLMDRFDTPLQDKMDLQSKEAVLDLKSRA
jgi:hypothetical protein